MRFVTYGLLLDWAQQAHQLVNGSQQQNPPLMGFLVNDRIHDFTQKNAIKINSVKAKVDALTDKYFFTIDGEIEYYPPVLDAEQNPVPNQQPRPKMKEGLKMEQYRKELQELMSKQIQVHI